MSSALAGEAWSRVLSLLALLSDWVCFSVAAAPETWVTTYNHDPATLIDIFLFTNVLFCFLEPSFGPGFAGVGSLYVRGMSGTTAS